MYTRGEHLSRSEPNRCNMEGFLNFTSKYLILYIRATQTYNLQMSYGQVLMGDVIKTLTSKDYYRVIEAYIQPIKYSGSFF